MSTFQESESSARSAALFELQNGGEFRIAGPGAAAALDRALALPSSGLANGRCDRNFLLDDARTILAELIVFRMDREDFFFYAPFGLSDADGDLLESRLPETLGFHDLSESMTGFALRGADSAAALAAAGVGIDRQPEKNCWTMAAVGGIRCILCRFDDDGFQLFCAVDRVDGLCAALGEGKAGKILEEPANGGSRRGEKFPETGSGAEKV